MTRLRILQNKMQRPPEGRVSFKVYCAYKLDDLAPDGCKIVCLVRMTFYLSRGASSKTRCVDGIVITLQSTNLSIITSNVTVRIGVVCQIPVRSFPALAGEADTDG